MIDALSSLSAAGAGAARAATRVAEAGLPPIQPAGAAGLPDFGRVFAEVASEGVGALRRAEAASIAGVSGGASVQAVVEAVLEAERTLQTAIAVRDKVVQAYQEISRMAI